jgi:hypothetical protein
MALADFLNPDELPDATEIDAAIGASGLIAPGRYHAALVEVEEKDVADTRKTALVFQILSGKFAHRKVARDLFHHGRDAEKTALCRNEMIHFATKLGVMVKVQGPGGQPRYVYAEGHTDFADSLQCECVIDVANEPYDRKDPKGRQTARVRMFGIYGLTDKEGVECMKGLGVTLAPGAHDGTTTPAVQHGHQPAANTGAVAGAGAATTTGSGQVLAGAAAGGKKRFNVDSL